MRKLTAKLLQSAPPRHNAALTGLKDVGRRGNADRLDVGVEGEGRLQLQDSHIIVAGHGVVFRIDNYRLDVNSFRLSLYAVGQLGSNQCCPFTGIVGTEMRKDTSLGKCSRWINIK